MPCPSIALLQPGGLGPWMLDTIGRAAPAVAPIWRTITQLAPEFGRRTQRVVVLPTALFDVNLAVGCGDFPCECWGLGDALCDLPPGTVHLFWDWQEAPAPTVGEFLRAVASALWLQHPGDGVEHREIARVLWRAAEQRDQPTLQSVARRIPTLDRSDAASSPIGWHIQFPLFDD